MRWQHPWLRIELAIRAVLADRLTQGPSEKVDQVLVARVNERGTWTFDRADIGDRALPKSRNRDVILIVH